METENKTTQDCGCDGDCCQPAKSKPWMKIIFFVIIAAAITIVTIKLVNKNYSDTTVKGTAVTTGKTGCGDTTKSKTCSKNGNSSCCSKENK